ncbi:MAG: transposase [Planctomycetaceae bacterium]|nr:transposase [Planctomycetaceae bacterium]
MSEAIRRRTYPSDLTEAQWKALEPLVTPVEVNRQGRKRETNLREVLNAINYRWMSGCVWRMLPHDLPAWNTVYMYSHRWERAGILSKIRTILLSSPARLPIVKQQILNDLDKHSPLLKDNPVKPGLSPQASIEITDNSSPTRTTELHRERQESSTLREHPHSRQAS